MKKQNKGFTIVELVIVIAVIAILAAVLIPTFSNIIKKAQTSSDTQLIRNLNGALAIALAEDGEDKFNTANDAFNAVEEAGYNVAKIVSKSGYNIAYDVVNGYFVLLDEKQHQVLYPLSVSESEVTNLVGEKEKDRVNYFVVRTNVSGETYTAPEDYSLYCGINFTAVNVVLNGVGFDAGTNNTINQITYTNSLENNNVVICTNSANAILNINDTTNSEIKHYGSLGKLVLTKCGYSCYYEFGDTAYAKAEYGKIVAKTGGQIAVLYATASAVVAKEDGGTITAAYCVSNETAEASSTGYTNFSNSKDGNVSFKYVKEGTSTAITEEYIEEKGTEVVEIAVEAERKETFAKNNYWIGVAADSFAGGKGTEAEPYKISNAYELARVAYVLTTKDAASYRSCYYILTDNIDLSAKCWIPISTEARKMNENNMFSGNFNGNNKTITGLNSTGLSMSFLSTNTNTTTPANTDGEYPYGLFGSTYNATISNLTLTNVSIKVGTGDVDTTNGKRYVGDSVGAVIGLAEGNLNMTNVTVESGTVEGYDCVGGVIGRAVSKKSGVVTLNTITNKATVNSVRQAGGVIGQLGKGTIGFTLTTLKKYGNVTTHFIKDYADETDANKKNYYFAAGITISKEDITGEDKSYSGLENHGILTNDVDTNKIIETIKKQA